MAQKAVQEKREMIASKLKELARARGIFIQSLEWRDVTEHDASELTIETASERKTIVLDDFNQLINATENDLKQLVEQIVQTLR